MCSWCEPGGWNQKTCNVCGDGHPAIVSISIATTDGSDYPYTTTDLCAACWDGTAEIAIEHNRELQ